MARKRGMVGKGSEKGASVAVSDLDQDVRSLRRVFKAIRALSPEARRFLRAKIQRM